MKNKTHQDLYNEIGKVEKRLDKHIEIYKENGEAVRENNELIKSLSTEFKAHMEETKPLIEFVHTASFGRDFIINTAKVFGAIGIIVASLIALVKGIR